MKFLNFLQSYTTYGNYGNYGNYRNYGNYGYNFPNVTQNTDFSAILGGIIAVLGIFLLIAGVIAILMIIANWKLFKKMGLEGWKSLIPFVKDYLQMEKTGVNQKWLLIVLFGGIIAIIPLIGFLIYLVAAIYLWILTSVSLARSFGKSDSFAVGLILLAPIFVCILAFGDSKYIGVKPMNDIIFKNNVSVVNAESNIEPKKENKNKAGFCPECGEKIKANDKFCPKCGKKL